MSPLKVRQYSAAILMVMLVPSLTACLVDEGSPEACRYGVAQDLDNERWEQALERLDSQACQRAMTEEERRLDRAAAHIGLAGYRLGDIVKVLLAPRQADEESSELRYLRRLGGLGISPGALRHLELALAEHQAMVSSFSTQQGEGLLQQACREKNLDQLSRLQKDACFQAGVFAHVRFSKALMLLLDGEIAAWTGEKTLDCDTDLANTGRLDAAEVSACALSAVSRLGDNSGTCISPTSTTGGVYWTRLPDYPQLYFQQNSEPLAQLIPLQISVTPGPSCSGRDEKRDYRLVRPSPGTAMAITEGQCTTEVTRSCSPLDSNAGCWPCPVPRAGGNGVQTVSETLLDPINTDAELMLVLTPGVESDRIADRLEESRQNFCEPARGTEAECEQREDGRTIVNPSALGVYLQR